MFEIDDKVQITELVMQPYIESLGLHKVSEVGIYVSFRGRGDYMSVDGFVTRMGCTGEIRKRIDFSHDDRFDDNWYEVYTNTSIACYQYLNFHESELILLRRANPMAGWLSK